MMKDLGLYLHVPFCVKKCNYCDFLSKEATEEEKEAYVDALIKEIKSYKKFAGNYKVSTVFVGGGTPSCLRAEQTKRIFDALYEIFEFVKHPEITTEMNPGTVDREKLEVYKACGINRLSIGMQSVKDENLKVLGRIHNFEQLLEAYQLAREAGFTNIIMTQSLQEAVEVSSREAKSGDAVLLSPACASWDMFKSYEERGKLFKEYVRALQ